MKTVIIGGTSGIGLAAAQKFIESGDDVIIAGRSNQKLQDAVKHLGNGVKGYVVDATSEESLKSLYEEVGTFENLVLTLSGAKGAGPFTNLNLTDLQEGFEAKFWAQVKAIKMAIPYMKKDGSITLLTAVSAQMASPGTSGLAAINGALDSMIPVLAVELSPMRINGVAPGVVDTDWWNWLPEADKQATFKEYADASLVGSVGKPEQLADAIFAITTNTFITGQVLAVDGGLKLK